MNQSDSEAGTGLIGSIVGVTIFLVLLLYAVQLALNLYATSTVTAVTFDAARQVAGSNGGPDATGRAEDHARDMLDRYDSNGGRLDFRWDTSRDDVVILEVTAERPSFFAHLRVPFQRIHRTVAVRWERAR